ncbi:unnamed protein product [Sphagnum tenellum]
MSHPQERGCRRYQLYRRASSAAPRSRSPPPSSQFCPEISYVFTRAATREQALLRRQLPQQTGEQRGASSTMTPVRPRSTRARSPDTAMGMHQELQAALQQQPSQEERQALADKREPTGRDDAPRRRERAGGVSNQVHQSG